MAAARSSAKLISGAPFSSGGLKTSFGSSEMVMLLNSAPSYASGLSSIVVWLEPSINRSWTICFSRSIKTRPSRAK